jgi:hypothetical protein
MDIKKPAKLKALKKLEPVPQPELDFSLRLEDERPNRPVLRVLRQAVIDENLDLSILPKVSLPKTSTIIKIRPKMLPDIIVEEDSAKKGIETGFSKAYSFEVDKTRKLLVIKNEYEKEEFPLDTLVSETSKTGKSIDKKDAIRIANTYLGLGIKPQNKKNIFIKAIRDKIGIGPEI